MKHTGIPCNSYAWDTRLLYIYVEGHPYKKAYDKREGRYAEADPRHLKESFAEGGIFGNRDIKGENKDYYYCVDEHKSEAYKVVCENEVGKDEKEDR